MGTNHRSPGGAIFSFRLAASALNGQSTGKCECHEWGIYDNAHHRLVHRGGAGSSCNLAGILGDSVSRGRATMVVGHVGVLLLGLQGCHSYPKVKLSINRRGFPDLGQAPVG